MQTLSQYVIAWLAHFFVFAFVYFADTKSHRQIDCKTREFRKFFVTHILIYLVTLFQFLTIKLIFLLIYIEIEMTALIIVAVTSWFMYEILFFSIQSWKIWQAAIKWCCDVANLSISELKKAIEKAYQRLHINTFW